MDKEAMIKDYLPFVKILVNDIKKRLPADVNAEELEAHGRLGLVEAANKYNPAFSCSFRTYAYYRVRGTILDALRYDKTVKLDRTARYLNGANSFMESGLVRESDETAYISAEEFSEAVNSLGTIHLLSEYRERGVDGAILKNEKDSMIRHAMNSLPERERRVIRLIYFEDRSFREVAEELKTSKSAVSRLHRRAIELLQKILSDENE